MAPSFTALLIDDNEVFLSQFAPYVAECDGLEVIALSSVGRAFEWLEQKPIDLIICDIQMPEMSGPDFYRRVQDLYPDVPIIFITAFASTPQAIQLVKQGAFHYFEKPVIDKLDIFHATVREALLKRKILNELSLLRKEKFLQVQPSSIIIGESSAIEEVRSSIIEIAELPVTVLITGETGTGKDLVARAIHAASSKREENFLAVNCGGFAEGVLESELFGHEKGAFTGAIGRKQGFFEVADKGTLFLDEISEATHSLQTKLLRVLETKMFTRVGGNTPIRSDFRIIAATNRNLEQEVASGRFRQDLLYRLNVFTIEAPPLRERRSDIPILAEYYLDKFRHKYNRSIEGISGNAMAFLMDYDWPGNVRELVNVMERSVITCKKSLITLKELIFVPKHDKSQEDPDLSHLNLQNNERLLIRMALKHTQGSKTRAAELLGINRKTLHQKMKFFGMDDSPEQGAAPFLLHREGK